MNIEGLASLTEGPEYSLRVLSSMYKCSMSDGSREILHRHKMADRTLVVSAQTVLDFSMALVAGYGRIGGTGVSRTDQGE